MRSVEVSAKTREEAIQQALKELGAERHEVDVDIIDEGSRGLFGLGARDVQLRVTCETAEEEAPPARPSQARESSGRASNGSGAAPSAERAPSARRRSRRSRAARKREEASSAGGRSGQQAGRHEASASAETPTPVASAPVTQRQESQERQGRKREDADARKAPGRQPRKQTPESGKEDHGEESRSERREERREASPHLEPVSQARAAEAASLTKVVIDAMGMESDVNFDMLEDGGVCLNVSSPDSAILIGRKGQTLASLQYLINRMVRSDDDEATQLITLDVEGYLERRRQSLREMAERLAERAKEQRRRIRLKPLSPQERREVHVALQDDADIRTFSVGEGALRSVIIAPKDEEPREQRRETRRRGGGGNSGNRSRYQRNSHSRPERDRSGDRAGNSRRVQARFADTPPKPSEDNAGPAADEGFDESPIPSASGNASDSDTYNIRE